MCIHPSLRCLLLAFACISTPASAADKVNPHVEPLLAALDVSKNAEVILSVAAQTFLA